MPDKKTTTARVIEMRSATDADLKASIESARKTIYLDRKDRLSKPQENFKIVRHNRKEIARALTIIREREISSAKEGAN